MLPPWVGGRLLPRRDYRSKVAASISDPEQAPREQSGSTLPHSISDVRRQSNSGELPPSIRREEVAVGRADVRQGGRTAPAAQDELVAHELAVVFAQGPRHRPVARIRDVLAPGPLPDVAVELSQPAAQGCRGGVHPAGFEKVPLDWLMGGDGLPLGLGGQPAAGPAGIGVGLEVADVGHRGLRFDRPHALEAEVPPGAVLPAFPVERGGPFLGLDREPAVREPEFGPAVAAVVDERLIFRVGDESIAQLERPDVLRMARALIVERESVPLVPDRGQARLDVEPAHVARHTSGRCRRPVAVGGP